MVHNPSQFEVADDLGTTSMFGGSVGAGNTSIPTVAGNQINEVMIRNPSANGILKNLLYSFDGGTTFFTLTAGEFILWTMKGNAQKQVIIKGNIAAVAYEILMNREPV